MPDTLTHFDRGALIKRGAIIESGKARLAAEWTRNSATGETDGRFVMRGPSGVHTLMIHATDTQRLNAHWQVFASHSANLA